jgi:cytochrome bd-type quinol oxidase subunit 1
VGSLTLVGAGEEVLYTEERDNTVGCSAERLAVEIKRLAEGRRSPFLVWNVTWITSLFATVLLLLIPPILLASLLRRVRPRADAERVTLVAFVCVASICAAAWVLAVLGRFPAPLAAALGLPPGI